MREAFDMDLSFEEVAMIFALKGWLHGTNRKAGVPNAEQLKAHIEDMISSLAEQARDGRILFNSSGRFTVHTDPEMPDSYEIHLYLGNVDRQKLGVSV
ncbi:hypothetical protein AB0I72_27365 [Nocardiopsis sp. NPDC049922]|uniref:hypothetical protein n=1 Tax=Nocardiopsis sp. NPDC049922 TaxID=3155157 RepID=UPI0033EA9488